VSDLYGDFIVQRDEEREHSSREVVLDVFRSYSQSVKSRACVPVDE
jgi:hypothetical protein